MNRCLSLVVILFFSHILLAQKDDDTKIVLSPKQVLSGEGFEIQVQQVTSNPYNAKFESEGLQFYELQGYRLSDVLVLLGRKARVHVRVNDLDSNPRIALRVICSMVTFQERWPLIFQTLKGHYGFRSALTSGDVIVNELQVANPTLLTQHVSKQAKAGVVKSSEKKKDGSVQLTRYSVSDLASWLEATKNESFEVVNGDGNRYNFVFQNSDEISNVLSLKYGIVINPKRIKATIYAIGD